MEYPARHTALSQTMASSENISYPLPDDILEPTTSATIEFTDLLDWWKLPARTYLERLRIRPIITRPQITDDDNLSNNGLDNYLLREIAIASHGNHARDEHWLRADGQLPIGSPALRSGGKRIKKRFLYATPGNKATNSYARKHRPYLLEITRYYVISLSALRAIC